MHEPESPLSETLRRCLAYLPVCLPPAGFDGSAFPCTTDFAKLYTQPCGPRESPDALAVPVSCLLPPVRVPVLLSMSMSKAKASEGALRQDV